MSPAQRRRKLKGSISHRRKPVFLLVIVVLVTSFIVFKPFDNNLKGPKNSLVISLDNGDVVISTFDMHVSEVTNIIIPGDTQVEVSRGLGVWKIKSVWELGVNERLGGRLLAETVTSYFKMPVFLWSDSKLEGFARGDLTSTFKSLISKGNTNLSLIDKVRITIFTLGVKNTKRVEINLADTVLQKRVLKDATHGYVLSSKLPQKILIVFSDPEISTRNLRVQISDLGGSKIVTSRIAEVVEVLGANVSSVTQEEGYEENCKVVGYEKEVIEKISELFGCDSSYEALGNFDLILRVGEGLSKRF